MEEDLRLHDQEELKRKRQREAQRENEARLRRWREYEEKIQGWRDYVARVEQGKEPDEVLLELARSTIANAVTFPSDVSQNLLFIPPSAVIVLIRVTDSIELRQIGFHGSNKSRSH